MTPRVVARLAALLLLVLLFPLATGVEVRSALIVTGMVGLQWWSGVWLWSRLRPDSSSWERLGAGLALGTTLSTFSGLIVSAAFSNAWGWAVTPLAVAAGARLLRSRQERAADVRDEDPVATWAGIGVGLGFGILGLAWAIRSYPLGTGDWSRYHPDMGFFEALGNSLASFGPLASIFSPESVIRYHWLVYSWSGQIQVSSGAAPFTVLTRFLPVVALIGAVLIAVAWTSSLTKSRWAPALASSLLVIGGFVGASYGTVLNFDSPSVAFTTMSLMALVWLTGTVSAKQHANSNVGLPVVLVLSALAVMVSGGKVSSAAVAVGSVGVLWLASFRTPSINKRAASVALVSVAGGSLFAFALVALGAADPGGLRIGDLLDRSSSVQGMNPFPGSMGILAGTVLLALAVVFRGAGALWLIIDRQERTQPWAWLSLGLIISSLLPILTISGGFNEVWFAVAAAAPLSVLSAVGLARAVGVAHASRIRASLGVLVVGSLLTSGAVIWAWSTGPSGGNTWISSLRWSGPLLGVLGAVTTGAVLSWINRKTARMVQTWVIGALIAAVLVSLTGRSLTLFGPMGTQPGMRSDMFTSADPFVDSLDASPPITQPAGILAAAQWLQQNSQPHDLLITNITRWPTVAALTNRQTLASGIWYQAPYGLQSQLPMLLQRERESWDFISNPSVETALPLCRYSPRWVLVDTNLRDVPRWQPWAEEVFSSAGMVVLRWNESSCEVDAT